MNCNPCRNYVRWAYVLPIFLFVFSVSARAEEGKGASDEFPPTPSAISIGAEGEEEQASESIGRESEQGDWYFWLYALEEYRFRKATSSTADQVGSSVLSAANYEVGEESDHDFRLYFDGGAVDPSERYRGNLAMGLWWDVDGDVPKDEIATFSSIYDKPNPWFDVYVLSAEYNSHDILKLARAGRQVTEHGLPSTFDGLSFLLNPDSKYLDIFVFGGRSVYFFEAGAEVLEDWLGSTGFTLKPSRNFKLDLDYRFIREVRGEVGEVLYDNSYGATGWYRLDDWFNGKLYARGIDDVFSQGGGAAKLAWASLDAGLNLNAHFQPMKLGEINELENPYFAIRGESLPNVRWHIDIWKNLKTSLLNLMIQPGFEGRNLLGEDETPFNRNVGRLYLLFGATEVLTEGLFFNFVIDKWGDDYKVFSDEIGLYALGGSLGYDKWGFRGEAGSYYQRFKYNYYNDLEEIEDVRTFFVDLSYKALKWLSVKGRYDYEAFDRGVHTVTLGLSETY
ncbi:MAG: hypothetical protein Kow0090_06730 [Myxococcota bacterium]